MWTFNFVFCHSHKIECTRFGTFVDELNNFLASGDLYNVVVILQFAKVKNFQGINTNSLLIFLYVDWYWYWVIDWLIDLFIYDLWKYLYV